MNSEYTNEIYATITIQQMRKLEQNLFPFLMCTAAQAGRVDDLEKLRSEVVVVGGVVEE